MATGLLNPNLERLERAERYRETAQRLRERAAAISDRQQRLRTLDLARQYETMADNLDPPPN